MKRPITIVEQGGTQKLNLPNELYSHVITHAYLYLQPSGWFSEYPCDEEGATPWYTFPAIQFLKDILNPTAKVLEYGSGYSTLFFKNKVEKLVTVEHNIDWANKLLAQNPTLDIRLMSENASIHADAQSTYDNFVDNLIQIRTDLIEHDYKHGLVNDEFGGYCSVIYEAPEQYYDMVVIDGMARHLCAIMTVESKRLKDNGVIILDNSDRWMYNPIQQYLHDNGFGRLDFWGPGWNNHSAWCTSFYSRKFAINNNRLLRPETDSPITV